MGILKRGKTTAKSTTGSFATKDRDALVAADGKCEFTLSSEPAPELSAEKQAQVDAITECVADVSRLASLDSRIVQMARSGKATITDLAAYGQLADRYLVKVEGSFRQVESVVPRTDQRARVEAALDKVRSDSFLELNPITVSSAGADAALSAQRSKEHQARLASNAHPPQQETVHAAPVRDRDDPHAESRQGARGAG